MAIFKRGLVSSQDLTLVFSVSVFVIFSWSILHILYEVPAWIIRLNTWDLVGVIAYSQAFALLESVLVCLVFIVVGAILPARFFRKRFVAQASAMVLISAAWVILAHRNDEIFGPEHISQLSVWFVAYLVSLGVSYALVHRYPKLETAINSFANRVTLLASVYVAIGLLSVALIVFRNV